METPVNDTTSVKSLKSPSAPPRKQVGFARVRPTLIIPPPQLQEQLKAGVPFTATSSGVPFTATSSLHQTPLPNHVYWNRKHSVFNFEQLHGIRDFTKSGLGVGEKCLYFLYNKLRKWSRKWFTHFFLTIVLALYTVGGALIFEYIEGKNEDNEHKELRDIRYDLIEKIIQARPDLCDNVSLQFFIGNVSKLLKSYEKNVVDQSAWYARTHEQGETKIWTFWNAIVFCGTIYTSIGYGHIYPETVPGKALTIVYAIVGMPLFLLALTDFGKLFTRCIKFLWSYVRRLYYTGSCRRARKTAHVEEFFKGAQMMYEIATFRRPSTYVVDAENPTNPDPNNPPAIAEDTPTTPAISNFEIDDEFNLPISLAIFILVLYIFLGATVYCVWEHWNFFDSFYFVFISMSTIGFGDMVPNDPVIMIVSIVYLVFGLALMSMCINVVQEKLSDTFKQASTKIGATMGITVAEEDGSITVIPAESVELPKVHHGNADVNTEEEKNTAEPTEE